VRDIYEAGEGRLLLSPIGSIPPSHVVMDEQITHKAVCLTAMISGRFDDFSRRGRLSHLQISAILRICRRHAHGRSSPVA